MRIKRFLTSTIAGIISFCCIIPSLPSNQKNVYASENIKYTTESFGEYTFNGYGISNSIYLDVNDSKISRGNNGQILRFSFKDNGKKYNSNFMAVSFSLGINDGNNFINESMSGKANLSNGFTYMKNKATAGELITTDMDVAAWLSASAKGTATNSIRLYMNGKSTVPGVLMDNKITVEVLTPIKDAALDCSVKYQLRGNNPYDVRFIGEVDAEQIEKAESATATVSKAVNDDPDHFTDVETTTITKAYKSIIANGQKQEAPEGKYFLISAVASDLTDGDKAKAVFSLDGASGESDRTVVIGNVPESSSEEESSSEPEESSSEAEDSSSNTDDSSETDSNVIWKGSENLGNWDTDVDLGVTGIPQAKKDGILTIEYTSVTGAASDSGNQQDR